MQQEIYNQQDYKNKEWFERVDPRIKLLLVFATSLLAVVLENPLALGALAVAAFFLMFLARLHLRHIRPLFLLVALATWGTVFSQALFHVDYPRTVLVRLFGAFELGPWHFEGIAVTREGIRHGLIQALRLDAMLIVGTTVCFKTGPEKLFIGLTRLGIPYGLSFMAITALRFVPTVLQEMRTARTLRRLRGYRAFRHGIRRTLHLELSTLKPVLVKSLRRATDLATALSLRAFDPLAERNHQALPPLSRGAQGAIVLLVGLTGMLVLSRLLFVLYLRQIFYREELRGLYAFAREWL